MSAVQGIFSSLFTHVGYIYENSVENAKTVKKTNFYSAKLLAEALLPYFCSFASKIRILKTTSTLGTVDKVRNIKVKEILDVGEEDIEGVVNAFLEDVKRGTWKKAGWSVLRMDYTVSKLALNTYTRVLAKRYSEYGSVSVNNFCPMTCGKGTHTTDAAALVEARLALLPPHPLPTAQFFF
ncbi:(+)-neomenthol dehydrogenase-like [Benincasa hispida]|uniref:(+)-neomenthol dehydrogenase-like n=1 Tax=Benincasa hispida TaxID=102211 RepID=UPI001900E08F|nr:(+)-neomenthol dehydrogenase-like [Benincasa hispida]